MSGFAIDLNDRALAFARAGEVLSSTPSAVFDGSGPEAAGSAAWDALRLRPTAVSTRHLRDLSRPGAQGRRALALLAAELRRRLQECGPRAHESVWVAAPAGVEAHGLGILLGLAGSLALRVEGFLDAAVVSVAALGLDRPALVLDIGLHHCAVTAVEGRGASVGRRCGSGAVRGGLMELYQSWLTLLGTTLVKRTRFDPLRDAATEQGLFAAVPLIAREAAARGSAAAVVAAGGRRFETVLSADQLAQAAAPIYRELLGALHALRTAGAPVALLVPRIALELPGLAAQLERFTGCELIALADGHAAAALSLLDLPRRAPEVPVRLLRRLPARALPECAPLASRRLIEGAAREPQPTHVLFDGNAIALEGAPVTIGRAVEEARGIALPAGLAAVSRRHCTLIPGGAETLLVDHSSFGTFVNGERVLERASVRAGDRIRIGDPGVELALLAIDAAAGEGDATPQD